MTEDSERPSGHDVTTPLEEGEKDRTTPLGARSHAPWGFGAAFRPGDLVSDRYRIVALLGEGGMGEVYEALDLELEDSVALKTIRASVATEENAVARFRREIQLARKVTHPNVSRLFDVGNAQISDAGGHERRFMYVTMELLRGETLSERLQRRGRMVPSEALPIVQQICAGLAAAHDAGIVHRDFKSANVMLVNDERSGRARAVVTDFGLARSAGSEARLTTAGQVMGTPAYMAPEQVEGGEVTPATDVYALGVVMYEMLSNEMPFAATTPIQAALMRLQHPPRPLREVVPGVDARWEEVIDRCLARSAGDRFASVDEASRALIDTSVPVAPPVKRRRPVPWAILLTLLALLLASIVVWATRRHSESADRVPRAAERPVIKPRTTVAVLGFRNLSGSSDVEWFSTAFAEMLTTELSAGEVLRTVAGDDVARMRLELGLNDNESHGKETLSRIRENIGTDFVVAGSYLAIGDGSGRRIRLDLRLQNAKVGETVATLTENGTEAEMIELIGRTGARLRQALGISASPGQSVAARASMPVSSRAARYYVDGLEKLRVRDALGATRLLAEAIGVEPDFPLTHSALAEAWTLLGYDTKAANEAKRAFELSKNLAREERLEVEARYRAATHDWKRAEELYRSLMTFFPDDIEYGLRLADVQSQSGRGKEALKVIAELRRMPTPLGDDPRIDIVEADVAAVIGDYEVERRAGAAAATKARARGARLLLAEARLHEAWGLTQLSKGEEAAAAFDEAEKIFRDSGDRGGVAQVWQRRSLALRNAGDLHGAIRITRQALELYRQIGNRRGIATSLGTIGVLQSSLGESTKAREQMEQALLAYREIGDRANEAWALGAIATTYQRQANFRKAEQYHLESFQVAREVGDVSQQGVTTHNLGEIYATQGRLKEASEAFTRALALFKSDPSSRGHPLASLSAIHLSAGDLARARATATEALELRRSIKEQYTIPSSAFFLAVVATEEGKNEEATALSREALKMFDAQERTREASIVRLLLARLATTSGRLEEAQRELTAVRPIIAKSEDDDVRVSLMIEEARLAVARRAATEETLRSLQNAVATARKRATIGLAYDAEVQAASVELSLGRREAALRRLQRIESEASARGFQLVVRNAKRLRS